MGKASEQSLHKRRCIDVKEAYGRMIKVIAHWETQCKATHSGAMTSHCGTHVGAGSRQCHVLGGRGGSTERPSPSGGQLGRLFQS